MAQTDINLFFTGGNTGSAQAITSSAVRSTGILDLATGLMNTGTTYSASPVTTGNATLSGGYPLFGEDLGPGHWRVRLGFLIAATFIGGTSLNIQVQGAVDASSGSYPANLSGLTWTTYAETGAIPQASLTAVAAGKANNSGLIVLEWPDRQIIANLPRFISINYNPVGTFSAGTIGTGAVFVGSLPDFDVQYYPSGFTVGS